MMKLMDKHKNIINLLGVCTQDGEGALQAGLRQGMGMVWGMGAVGFSSRQDAAVAQGRG